MDEVERLAAWSTAFLSDCLKRIGVRNAHLAGVASIAPLAFWMSHTPWPVTALMTRMVRWSLVCTTISSSLPQVALTR